MNSMKINNNNEALKKSYIAQDIWFNRTTQSERIDKLNECKRILRKNKEELIELEVKEVNKIFEDVRADFNYCMEQWEYAEKLLQQEKDCNLSKDKYSRILRPLGSILMITPWNYPFIVLSERLPYMLAAGNAVVWKPSEYTSECASKVSELLSEVLPKDLIQCIQGDGEQGRLLTKEGFDLISFTGSTNVGKQIQDKAHYNSRLELELGGKNHCIIDRSYCDEEALNIFIDGLMRNAGQSCIQLSVLRLPEELIDMSMEIIKKIAQRKEWKQKLAAHRDIKSLNHAIDALSSDCDKVIAINKFKENESAKPSIFLFDRLPNDYIEKEYFCPICIQI